MARVVIRNLLLKEVIIFLQHMLETHEAVDMIADDNDNKVVFRPVEDEETELKNVRLTDKNINDLI
jgi:hypothetical protein